MSDRSNSELMREAKAQFGLTNPELATLLHASKNTVAAWIRPSDNRGHLEPSLANVELLYRKLGLPLPPEIPRHAIPRRVA